MMAAITLIATAGLAERAVDLALSWASPVGAARSLRLVRRRDGFSVAPGDGRTILDLDELFPDGGGGGADPGQPPWGAVDVWRYALDNADAESDGLAEIVEYFSTPTSPQPDRVTVRIYDAPAEPKSWTFNSISKVTRETASTPQFEAVTTVKIFSQPSGGPETLAGAVVLSMRAVAGGPKTQLKDFSSGDETDTETQAAAPSSFVWNPASGPTVSVLFSREERQSVLSALQSGFGSFVSFLACAGERGALPIAIASASVQAPIAVTTASDHGLVDGASVSIAGATGNTAANGTWKINVTAPNQFQLIGSIGNGSYAGGGVVYPPILRSIEFSETSNPLTRQTDRVVSVEDRTPSLPPAAAAPVGAVFHYNPLTGQTEHIPRPTMPSSAVSPPGAVYYYTAYQDSGAGEMESVGAASVLSTSGAGFADQLFALLPSVHRYYDDPRSGLGGSWQLRRFLKVFGPALDHARSLSEFLPALHDPLTARAEVLPNLGHVIGWEIDRTLSTERQRADLSFAPEVFATIGVGRNLQALATRATGWRCEVKEFVNNVFLTNAAEPVRLRQIFEATRASAAAEYTAPALQGDIYPATTEPAATQADVSRVDGRPAAAIDSNGKLWLLWHSTRLGSEWQPGAAYAVRPFASVLGPQSADGLVFECVKAGVSGASAPSFPTRVGATVDDGTATWICRGPGIRRRRIWMQRLGVDTTPIEALADLPDGAGLYDETPTVVNAAGAMIVAWASNRGGHNEIWLRAWSGADMSPRDARRLTRGSFDDRAPALAVGGAANAPLNAFWESRQQSGRQILFASSVDAGANWTAPVAVSSGPQDRTPAAVVDAANQLHVFWSVTGSGGSHIRHGVQSGASWLLSDVTSEDYAIYDSAPAATVWNGAVQLFWHSNRLGSVWRPSTPYKPDDIVATPGGNGCWYSCVAAGTSGATQPTFPRTVGATFADGGAQWVCHGLMANAPFVRTTRIWSSVGPAFSARAMTFARFSNDSEPVAVVDAAGNLRLFFASQETGARFCSRTFDTRFAPSDVRLKTANLLAQSSMRGIQDRLHYIYDTRRVKEAYWARDTAGVYLVPGDGQSDAQRLQAVDRLRTSLTPFRPISTRLVYFLQLSGARGFTPVGADP